MNTTLLLQRIFDGIATGAIYAAVAVALVLIFKATTLINFAQGEMAMFGAFITYAFAVQSDNGFLNIFLGPANENIGDISFRRIWVSAVLAMIGSGIIAIVVERMLIRPFDPDDHLPVVLITLGLFLVINAVAGEIWNFEPRAMPALFPDGRLDVAGARLFYDTIGIILVLALMLGGLFVILGKTKMGLAFRAVSSNVESARLVGVRTGRVLGFGWFLASAIGTLGAVLVAPRLSLQPIMMGLVLIYALAAASIGGLDSLGGAALGGLIIGLTNSVAVQYLANVEAFKFVQAAPLILSIIAMLATLWFRPSGLFGTKRVERV